MYVSEPIWNSAIMLDTMFAKFFVFPAVYGNIITAAMASTKYYVFVLKCWLIIAVIGIGGEIVISIWAWHSCSDKVKLSVDN